DAEGGACPRAARGPGFSGCERAQSLLGVGIAAAEAELELGCGELILALEFERDLAPGLQVLERHPELLGEHAQGAQAGGALAVFDAADVGVPDARPRDVLLAQPTLSPQPRQPLPDRFRAHGAPLPKLAGPPLAASFQGAEGGHDQPPL